MPLRNVLVIAVMTAVSLVCYRTAARNRYANLFAEAMDVIDTQSLKEVPREELFNSAMNGMLQSLDKHSKYISGDVFRDFDETISQQFGGLGIYVDRDEEKNCLVVLATSPSTPAVEAGLKSGDRIVQINGTTTKDLTRQKGVELLRGKVGEVADLLIDRDGEMISVSVTRRIIGVESVIGDYRNDDGSWIFRLQDEPGIGYLKLNQFGERTAEEVEEAIVGLRGNVDSIIIDLRHNSGGLLTAAIAICDMFLPEGKKIVSTQGRNRVRRSQHVSTEKMAIGIEVPIVILVNRYSASASEIVAGCLQDHDRAVLIGEQSWGKGTVQNIIPVRPNRSAVRLTTASYWRPSGDPIDRYDSGSEESGIWGVRPEVGFLVDLTEDDVWRNLQKRNQRKIETLIPSERRDDLLPILLNRPVVVMKPREPGADPDDPPAPMEDTDINAGTLRDWNDQVMEKALEYLTQFTSRIAA